MAKLITIFFLYVLSVVFLLSCSCACRFLPSSLFRSPLLPFSLPSPPSPPLLPCPFSHLSPLFSSPLFFVYAYIEIFGPLLSVYVYQDNKFEETLQEVDSHNFALTGSIFATDRYAIKRAFDVLENAAGNVRRFCSLSLFRSPDLLSLLSPLSLKLPLSTDSSSIPNFLFAVRHTAPVCSYIFWPVLTLCLLTFLNPAGMHD